MRPVIIYPPTIDWDQLHQRPQQLLKAMSRQGAISLFCNLDLHRQHPEGIEHLSAELILANQLSLQQAAAWARTNFPSSPLIIYYTYPPQTALVRSVKADYRLFDSVDEPAGEFASWQNGYREAVSSADVVITSARSLTEKAALFTQQPVNLVPNGCDFEHFRPSENRDPPTCAPFTSGKPVIGYIGAIAPWLDWGLINTMAHNLPDFEFVFIGSLLLQRGVGFANKNMHYLGHKPYELLPVYLSQFSHCLIPFQITEMTVGVNPVKFWEYMASGRPVLSTALPEIPPEYVTVINEEMFPGFRPPQEDVGQDARIALARDNSWEKRAKEVLRLLHEKLEEG